MRKREEWADLTAELAGERMLAPPHMTLQLVEAAKGQTGTVGAAAGPRQGFLQQLSNNRHTADIWTTTQSKVVLQV